MTLEKGAVTYSEALWLKRSVGFGGLLETTQSPCAMLEMFTVTTL